MKKSRVLFVIRELNIGGVEKSLLSLLKTLPPDRFDIDLGVINARGGFLEHVPSNVRVFEIPALHNSQDKIAGRFEAIAKALRKGDLKNAVLIPLLYIRSKIARTLIPLYSYYLDNGHAELPEYDIAVAYQGPNEMIDYFVSHIVKAKKKFGWIHFDIDRCFIREKTTLKCYPFFDRIMVVSDEAKRTFDRRFPTLADKTVVMHNIIDKEDIMEQAKAPDIYEPKNDVCNICTVGRLAWVKGHDKAIEAARILADKGFRFHWTFVGDGPDRDMFVDLAKKLGVTEFITFAGAAENPYPFFAKCDIYVQPSRHEGYGIAVGEAKLFGTPIVATDFAGAHEQLDNVANAIIIPDNAPERLADAILKASKMSRISPDYEGNPPQLKFLI